MNAFEVVGRVSLSLLCFGIGCLGLCLLLEKCKILIDLWYCNVRQMVINSWWFHDNPEAKKVLQLVGQELNDNGSLMVDMGNLRAKFKREIKEPA